MLTQPDYADIAAAMTYPSACLIDGRKTAATGGATFATTNPANGAVLADLPACDAQDVDKAVASARAAFDSGVWSDLHPSERKAGLLKLAGRGHQCRRHFCPRGATPPPQGAQTRRSGQLSGRLGDADPGGDEP